MNRPLRIYEGLALVVPAAIVLCLVLRFGVNVPYLDQWDLINLLAAMHNGGLGWDDVFRQHNEHRMVFPKLVMLGLASVTRWNIVVELMVSVALAAASLVVLLALARPVLRQISPLGRLWAGFTLSAMLFSLAQWENWLWGWQIQWFLSLLAAVSVIALATSSLRASQPWPHVAVAAVAAVVCQYSIASGVVAWVAGGFVLAIHPRRHVIIPVWLLAAAGTTSLYFAGYVRPPHHPSLLVAVEQFPAFLVYVANYLSGPVGRSTVFGFVTIAAFVGIAAVAAFRCRRQPDLVLPWIALAFFAGANAVITGIGRVGFGAGQGLSSRYVTIALLLPMALVPLGILAFRAEPGRHGRRRQVAGIGAAAVLTGLVVSTDIYSLGRFMAESRKQADARECVFRIDDAADDCLRVLYPNPPAVRHWTRQLQAFGWSGFPATAAQPPGTLRIAGATGERLWRLRPGVGPTGWLDEAVLENGSLVVTGWARGPRERTEAAGIVLVTTGDPIKGEAVLAGEASIVGERADVAAFYNDPSLARSGWEMRVSGFSTPSEPVRLRAYVAMGDGVLVPIGVSATPTTRP